MESSIIFAKGMKVQMIYLNSSKMIKQIRIQRGYSVSELAEAADISTKFLYNIEAGKAGFSAKVLFNIATALHVSCDYILTGNENDEVTMMAETIKKLNSIEQRYLERILQEIVRMKSNIR